MIETHFNYTVEKSGDIINNKTGVKLKFNDNGKGYKKVELSNNGTSIRRYVHRLVAIAFVPNPNNYNQVNHINGIKSDNRAENLEWVNNSINQIHAHKNNLKKNGNALWNGKLSKEQVMEVKILKSSGVLQSVIAKKMKVSQSSISSIISGKLYKYI